MSPEKWQQVEAIYVAALAERPETREAYLDRACGPDIELRREVESLLECEPNAQTFLEEQAPETTQAMLGRQIGAYKVRSKLGAGGMGVVYLAHDSELGRDVAIKTLPPEFAADPARLSRFRREARTLASLNHPNIAAVYGMEGNALVMEYIPGETLRGPLPLDDVMKIARQIANALEAAHEKGIVHRDLKPANVKLTPEGTVKVLDFGLAKALAGGPPAASESPVLTADSTQTGVILGTPSYMSPEHAKGKPVDARTDIWAYGCLIYELLSGTKAFPGNAADAVAGVVNGEPDWSLLPPGSPVELLRACLQKDLSQRLRNIGDAVFILSVAKTSPTPAPAAPAGFWRRSIPWAVAAILAIAAVAGWYRATRPPPLRPWMRLSVELGGDAALARVYDNRVLALSPDGTRIAIVFRGADGKVGLGTRRLDQTQITPLPGTENATSPFFSPDSRSIGFFAGGKLKKISVEGGAVVTICDSANPRGASWGDDGYIVYAPGIRSNLVRVSSEGGTPKPITKLNGGEISQRWPQVLPGNRAVLFTSSMSGVYDNANIEVLNAETGERKILWRGGFAPRFVPTTGPAHGHLLYLHESSLFATPFDLRSLTLTGSPVPILEDVSSTIVSGGDYDVSVNGLFVYAVGHGVRQRLDLLDNAGLRQPIGPIGRYASPAFSPDGKRVAFSAATNEGWDIWVKDLERDTASRLSFLGGTNDSPVWTPDSRGIVFQSTDPKRPGIYWARSDGSGEAVCWLEGKFVPSSFSPNGKRLAFSSIPSDGTPDIYTATVTGDAARPGRGTPEPFLATSFTEYEPAFSPDGRWLAYSSDESGTMEVYVRPFPGPGGRSQISTGGGHTPRWSRAEHGLFFENPDGIIMASNYVVQGDTFVSAIPRAWSTFRFMVQMGSHTYDFAPDGRRVVGLMSSESFDGQKPLTHVTFLPNFFDELRRRTGTR